MRKIYMKKEDIPQGTIRRVRVYIEYYDADNMPCSVSRVCTGIESVEELSETKETDKTET